MPSKFLPGYGRHFLWYELGVSIIGIAITYLVVGRVVSQNSLHEFLGSSRQILYSSIAVIAGALLGFVIAGVTVLLVLPENRLLNAIKKTTAYSQVHAIFFSTLKMLAITTVVSLAALFVDTMEHPHVIMFYVVLWGLVISTLRIGRCVWVLENLIAITERGREPEERADG